MIPDAELEQALAGEMVPKFMGTLDARGVPNCVPVTTTTLYDAQTLVFGEFLMNKTRRNLLECAKVGVAVIAESFDTWSIRGTFLGFETTGDHVDFINQSPLFRYNAYTSIRAAGIIRIESVSPRTSLSKGRYLCDFIYTASISLLLRGNHRPPVMPRPVMEKFGRFSAVRAIAYVDERGYPATFATVAGLPAGPNRLLFGDPLFLAHKTEIAPGGMVAVSILTSDPVAYQVKGIYRGVSLGVGIVDLAECYSASPPLLGERLDGLSRG